MGENTTEEEDSGMRVEVPSKGGFAKTGVDQNRSDSVPERGWIL